MVAREVLVLLQLSGYASGNGMFGLPTRKTSGPYFDSVSMLKSQYPLAARSGIEPVAAAPKAAVLTITLSGNLPAGHPAFFHVSTTRKRTFVWPVFIVHCSTYVDGIVPILLFRIASGKDRRL